MACKKIEVDEFSCERCGHAWLVRLGGKPAARCPKCKSPYWNSPRKLASGPKKGKTITIRPKATAPPAAKKPARVKRAVKADVPAAPATPATPAVSPYLGTSKAANSRHCSAGAHAGCGDKTCECACHKAA